METVRPFSTLLARGLRVEVRPGLFLVVAAGKICWTTYKCREFASCWEKIFECHV